MFSLVFRGLGGEAPGRGGAARHAGRRVRRHGRVMLVMFLLGFFLDTFEIIFIVLPIFGRP